MGFRLAQKPTYEVAVTVTFPVDGGRVEKHQFHARFKRLSQTQIEATLAEKPSDRELLRDVLVGWRGVQDEDGKELDFTDEAREQVLDVYPMQPTLARAFLDSVLQAREKN